MNGYQQPFFPLTTIRTRLFKVRVAYKIRQEVSYYRTGVYRDGATYRNYRGRFISEYREGTYYAYNQ